MTDVGSLRIRYSDAFVAGVCGTQSRVQFSAVGLDWRTFVRTGYSVDELFAAFGKEHPVVTHVVDFTVKRRGL